MAGDKQALIDKLKSKFNPEAAVGKDLVFQFVIEDDQNYCLNIKEGMCDIIPETVTHADITLTLTEQTLQALLEKEMNALTALMSGKVRIDGNPLLAMQLSQLFSI